MIREFPSDYEKGTPLRKVEVTLSRADGKTDTILNADTAQWDERTRHWTFTQAKVWHFNNMTEPPDLVAPPEPIVVKSWAETPWQLIKPGLSPAYLGVDPRLSAVAASLGRGRAAFLLRVKWPLLRRSLAASVAVGFAVSVAQYLPTLYVGAGRYASVTTEAVTLAAGAQRSLTSAYAALQFLLPVAGFALAAWFGRPRRFTVGAP